MEDFTAKNLRKLAPGKDRELAEQPSWSPDGKQLVVKYAYSMNLSLIDADGRNRRELTKQPGTYLEHPDWSPDGQWITFTSYRDRNSEIYVVRPDGSGLRNLTRHPAHDDFAAWSPDGRWLAFVSARDGGFDIYCLNVPADLKIGSRPPRLPSAVGKPAAK